MKENSLKQLEKLGQAVWLDYIRRDLMANGELRRLIVEDGLCGMTSNPSIFEKAIVDSHEYDDEIRKLALNAKDSREIYEAISQRDVQRAAHEFWSVYDETEGLDGYVSLEVNPYLANDTKETIAEARYLWSSLNCPNIFIKVPATKEGIPAIKQLISEGINVNVTLLFGLQRYQQVAEAYIEGLEERLTKGLPLKNVSSVASFFVSRIDTLVDPLLEKAIYKGNGEVKFAKKAHGQVGIASARAAYQMYKEIFESERFKKLKDHSALTQRLLWASTSTKNPNYSDIRYIEALIGVDTVNTITLDTMNAYRNHGDPKPRIEYDIEGSRQILQNLHSVGINIDNIAQQLEDEGVLKFRNSYDSLINSLEEKRHIT